MARHTPIEWASNPDGSNGGTWNPLVAAPTAPGDKSRWACVMASDECTRCYASTMNVRYGGTPYSPVGSHEPNARVMLDRAKLLEVNDWEPSTIFAGSMTDFFGDWVEYRDVRDIFQVACANPQHTFQFLTKRPQNALAHVKRYLDETGLLRMPDHTWFGCSVGLPGLSWRFAYLVQIPCSVHFGSLEPLIGPVDPTPYLGAQQVNWIVTGGESGPRSRPAHTNWFRIARDACQTAGVAYFHKQNGQWLHDDANNADDERDAARVPRNGMKHVWPDGSVSFRMKSKHDAGRSFDGEQYDGIPARPWQPARELARA